MFGPRKRKKAIKRQGARQAELQKRVDGLAGADVKLQKSIDRAFAAGSSAQQMAIAKAKESYAKAKAFTEESISNLGSMSEEALEILEGAIGTFADLTGISDERRKQLLQMLSDRKVSTTELAELVGAAFTGVANVAQHLGVDLANAHGRISDVKVVADSNLLNVNGLGQHLAALHTQVDRVSDELRENGVLGSGSFSADLKNGMVKIFKQRVDIASLTATFAAMRSMNIYKRHDSVTANQALQDQLLGKQSPHKLLNSTRLSRYEEPALTGTPTIIEEGDQALTLTLSRPVKPGTVTAIAAAATVGVGAFAVVTDGTTVQILQAGDIVPAGFAGDQMYLSPDNIDLNAQQGDGTAYIVQPLYAAANKPVTNIRIQEDRFYPQFGVSRDSVLTYFMSTLAWGQKSLLGGLAGIAPDAILNYFRRYDTNFYSPDIPRT